MDKLNSKMINTKIIMNKISKILDEEFVCNSGSDPNLEKYIQATFLMRMFVNENDINSFLMTMKKFGITKIGFEKCVKSKSKKQLIGQLFEDLKNEITSNFKK